MLTGGAATTAEAGAFLLGDFVELVIVLATFAAVGAGTLAAADVELSTRLLDAPLSKHDNPLEAACML